MIWLIISIIVTVGLFVVFGFKEVLVEVETYRGIKQKKEVVWKVNKRQFLCLLGLLICLFGFFTKIPANSVGIVYSPFGGTKEQTQNLVEVHTDLRLTAISIKEQKMKCLFLKRMSR